ncbi:MAG: flippase-like domain-containing protein [bacterium]|jgi:hypothetical protein
MQIGARTFRVGSGLTIFLAISVVSALVIIIATADPGTWAGLRRMRPGYIALASVLMVIQWCLNGIRFRILVNSLGNNVSLLTSFKAFMTNIFLGAVTPSQTGGGPMQIYVLSKAGVPVSKAFAGCLMGAVLTVICLVSSALAVLLSSPALRSEFGPRMTGILLAAVVVFGLLVLTFVLSLTRTRAVKRLIGRTLLAAMRALRLDRRIGFTKRVLGGVDQYRESMSVFARTKKSKLVAALLITMAAISTNALIAPVLLSGLNIEYDIATIYPAQFILFFIAYFGPTPGASGIAEFSNFWILTTLSIQPNLLGIYTVLWRFFTIFVGVTVGGLIVLSLLPRRKELPGAESV